MKYAIIRLQGQQFKVQEGEEFLVNYLGEDKPNPEVLMIKTEDKTFVGKPLVEKATVKLTVVSEEEKGKKLYVTKYKSKSRYRRKIGFRPKFTLLKVDKIN